MISVTPEMDKQTALGAPGYSDPTCPFCLGCGIAFRRINGTLLAAATVTTEPLILELCPWCDLSRIRDPLPILGDIQGES